MEEKYLNRDEVLRYEENVGSFFGYKTKEEIIDCLKNCRKFLKKIIRDLELLPEDMLILRYDKEKILDIEIPKNSITTNQYLFNDYKNIIKEKNKKIFIVHGHDKKNLKRLVNLIKDRFNLEPIILSMKPEKGRTIIEKFEQEAINTFFSIVLFTPDDLIQIDDSEYFQARPNVFFELGWFYGKTGRQRVCKYFTKEIMTDSHLKLYLSLIKGKNLLKITNYE